MVPPELLELLELLEEPEPLELLELLMSPELLELLDELEPPPFPDELELLELVLLPELLATLPLDDVKSPPEPPVPSEISLSLPQPPTSIATPVTIESPRKRTFMFNPLLSKQSFVYLKSFARQVRLTSLSHRALFICGTGIESRNLDGLLDGRRDDEVDASLRDCRRTYCFSIDDDRGKSGDAQFDQFRHECCGNLERASIVGVAFDHSLGSAVMADVEFDVNARDASLAGSGPREWYWFARFDRNGLGSKNQRRNADRFDSKCLIKITSGVEGNRFPFGKCRIRQFHVSRCLVRIDDRIHHERVSTRLRMQSLGRHGPCTMSQRIILAFVIIDAGRAASTGRRAKWHSWCR